jgi:hypothetical protein
MHNNIIPLLILNARPAAGKSELIRELQALPDETRLNRFHIGSIYVIDDFPMLWSWFEEDRLLEEVFNRPRLHTNPDEYFLHNDLWHLLVRRLGLDYEKWVRDSGTDHTVILEFSRGTEHGGYQAAYQHLSQIVLEQAACLYIQVSFEESLRKNNLRFNPDRPDSILQHALEPGKIKRLYEFDDWHEFTRADSSYLQVHGFQLPYVVYENEDDLTTQGGEAMLARLEQCLSRLWALKHPDDAV